MSKKNDFLDIYLSLPEVKLMRKYILTTIFFTNLFLYFALYTLYKSILFIPMPHNIKVIMFYSLFIFDIISLIFILFIKKLDFLLNLYTAISYSTISIFYFYIAINAFYYEFNNPINIIVMIASLIIYILCIYLLFKSIKNKLKNNIVRKPLNKAFVRSIISSFVIFGMYSSKNIDNSLFHACSYLIFSCCCAAFSPGFHQFYLRFKHIKLN